MWNEECIEENAFLLCSHTHTQKKEKEKKGYHAQKIQMNSHA